MKRHIAILAFTAATLTIAPAADQYWRTDGATGGTWTSTYWNTGSANAAGGTAWTSGSNAVFTADSTLTFATSTVGNVTVAANKTVTITKGGTLSLGAVRTFDIGAGALLDWRTQSVTANSAAGITKNGQGTLRLDALTFTTAMNGGFTLNDGTVIVSGLKALGNGAMTLNGGTLQSSGGNTYAVTSLAVGGDFVLSGTGNDIWSVATTIGSATRTITNSTTSGSRAFTGLVSGGSGAGLTFTGTGAGSIYLSNASNSFNGPVTITGGEVGFTNDGSLGTGTSIVLNGGHIASSDTAGNAVTSTWSSSRSIQIGDTAGTGIKVSQTAGDLTYNGIISNVTGKTGAWAKQGTGTLRLGGVSTYTGATAIESGTLQLTTGNNRLPTGTVVSIGQAASTNLGTLDLNSQNQQIAGLKSTAGSNAGASTNIVTSVGSATLTINCSTSTSYTYSAGTAANSGIISGAINLVKLGDGTQVLGGANSYTGTTTVGAGTLEIDGIQSGTGLVTVQNGGTLGGDGGISGSLHFDSGANFLFSPTTTFTVNGSTVDFANFGITNLIGLTSAVDNGSYTLIDGTATFDFTHVLNFGSANAYDLGGGKSAYFEAGSLNLVVVPEPSAALLGGIGVVALLGRRRARR